MHTTGAMLRPCWPIAWGVLGGATLLVPSVAAAQRDPSPSVRSDAEMQESAPESGAGLRWLYGGGLGVHVLSASSFWTSGWEGEVSAGIESGRFSLRMRPTFEYLAPSVRVSPVSLGYVALDSVFRIVPWFAVSIAPIAGFLRSPAPPYCYDVCYASLTNDTLYGVDVSPVTLVQEAFGGRLEIGAHATLLVLAQAGWLEIFSYLGARWLFSTKLHWEGPTAPTTVISMRVLAVVTVGLAVSMALAACRGAPSLTTNTRSETLPTAEERVAFLGRYLRLRSAVRDAAFAIDYHDNSTGLLPGPSDWNIWAAMLLPQGAMSSWLGETRPCEQDPKSDLDKIVPATWKVSSPARCLHRDGSTLLVHDPEDVLIFFASTHWRDPARSG